MNNRLLARTVGHQFPKSQGSLDVRILDQITELQQLLEDSTDDCSQHKELFLAVIETLSAIYTHLERDAQFFKQYLEGMYGEDSCLLKARQEKWSKSIHDSEQIRLLIRDDTWYDLLDLIKIAPKLKERGIEACSTYAESYVRQLREYMNGNGQGGQGNAYQQWQTRLINMLGVFKSENSEDTVIQEYSRAVIEELEKQL